MLPRLRVRFVLAAGVSAKVTLHHLALEVTKRARPNTIRPPGPVETHFVFRGHSRGKISRGQNSLRRDGSLGGCHPANVWGDA